MTSADPAEFEFELDAGRVCLDFVNTLSRTSGEHLHVYADLIAFARQAALLTPEEAGHLHALAATNPSEAASVLRRAKRLRSVIYRIFSAVAAGQAPSQGELDSFNVELAASRKHERLVLTSDGKFVSECCDRDRGLDSVLWPITRSAADLLTSDTERGLVRECAAAGCAWLFLDTTRNRSRQWCSMQVCGNREKARRHYRRIKSSVVSDQWSVVS